MISKEKVSIIVSSLLIGVLLIGVPLTTVNHLSDRVQILEFTHEADSPILQSINDTLYIYGYPFTKDMVSQIYTNYNQIQ